MNTPIFEFVTAYKNSAPVRLHMPGHKGRAYHGVEDRDLTEIPGADSLYEASGVIAESEANASRLFGCPTFYSTEGSSQCIRAMLYLAMRHAQNAGKSPKILAARNAHKTFLSAAALLDLDVCWLIDSAPSYLSACPTPASVTAAIEREQPTAVYLTSPDYLGNMIDLAPIARVCHDHGVLLLVDSAHGAYLRFFTPSRHPMDLGADLCCGSAHKTLSALTGAAYLHVSPALCGFKSDLCHSAAKPKDPDAADPTKDSSSLIAPQNDKIARALAWEVKDALALFGSTSPSYLILQSLDLLNPQLETLPARLNDFLPKLSALKARLRAEGWTLYGDEPLKLTLLPKAKGYTGSALAALLERSGVFCEFTDPDFLVCMFTPDNEADDLYRLERALAAVPIQSPIPTCPPRPEKSERVCSLRSAMLSPRRIVPVSDSFGAVLARPDVGCPPAVPILMPGERINEAAIEAFSYYGIDRISVL